MRDLNWIQLNVARAFRPSGTLQNIEMSWTSWRVPAVDKAE